MPYRSHMQKRRKPENVFCVLISFFSCGPSYPTRAAGAASRSFAGLREEPHFFS